MVFGKSTGRGIVPAYVFTKIQRKSPSLLSGVENLTKNRLPPKSVCIISRMTLIEAKDRPHNPAQIFKRELSLCLIFDLFIFAFYAGSLWMLVTAFFFYTKYDVIEVRWVSLALTAFCPVLLWGRIYAADIYVGDDGIAWWLWGRPWRSIRWSDVTAMTIETITVRNYLVTFATSYCIYTTEKRNWLNSQLHGMRFDGDILNADKLIAAVTGHLIEHNVPVFDERTPGH